MKPVTCNNPYLLIDTSERDTIRLSFFDEATKQDVQREASNRDLLKVIDDFLTVNKVSKDTVAGIMTVVGEGGFTSTRLATTVANTFAYVQKIPVLAISKEQVSDPQALISALSKQPIGQYISATYSAPPNINMVKKK